MKRIISLILFLLMLLSCFTLMSSAVSYKEGISALQEQFEDGTTDEMDYVCYSPLKKGIDLKKYPLVIWLHGNSSGDYPRHQLENSNIAMWSSEEYQKRFEGTEGAYIFVPRCPTKTLVLAWDGKQNQLKNTIDQFVAENINHIDTNRIYIGGYSMGGKMAVIMATRYTGFFAATYLMSPVYAPSNHELDALADTPVWLMVCKNDDYISLNQLTVKNNWIYLSGVSNNPEKNRLSTFDGIYRPDGSYCGRDEVHNTWNAACYDLFMDDGSQYKDMEIIDGLGKKIELTYPDGLISWLSQQSLQKETEEKNSFLQRIIDTIMRFFTAVIKIMGTIGGVV